MKKDVSPQSRARSSKEDLLFERLSRYIQSNQRFLITTHQLPDGDGLGGEIALASYLKAIGKECWIVNSDPTPEKFSLVDPDSEIEIWSPQIQSLNEKGALPAVDIIFALDVNDLNRVGTLHVALQKQTGPIIYIDHHISEEGLKGEHIIDPEISSMGEFLFRFFRYVRAEITFKMALAMYVSIFLDTHRFRHRRTTALSHAIAAALVDLGVNPAMVHQEVHQKRSLNEMHLLGEVLSQIQTTDDGKIAWVEIPLDLQKKYKASAEESQGFVDFLLNLKHIEIAVLFREEAKNSTRVSFRSKGKIEIYPFVKKLGGGGHAHEAGVLLHQPFSQAVEETLRLLKQFVD